MYSNVTGGALSALLLLLPTPLHAQDAENWQARAVSTIMHYRSAVIGDTVAKFDECGIARHLGDEAPVAPRLAEPVRWMLRPCQPARHPNTVRLDSLARRGDADVMVYVTVTRGEWVHREDYALVTHDSPRPLMGVREVRLWGAVQSYPRRPVPAAPPD
jgi:hypothetical protein